MSSTAQSCTHIGSIACPPIETAVGNRNAREIHCSAPCICYEPDVPEFQFVIVDTLVYGCLGACCSTFEIGFVRRTCGQPGVHASEHRISQFATRCDLSTPHRLASCGISWHSRTL